jgi:excisionase family DNA binding protein
LRIQTARTTSKTRSCATPSCRSPSAHRHSRALETHILSRFLADRGNSSTDSDGFSRLLTAKQLAGHLAVSESRVREQARIGELPSIKLGHYVRFRLDDVKRYISLTSRITTTMNSPANIAALEHRVRTNRSFGRIKWPQSNPSKNKRVPEELADVVTAWTTVLWAHAVHEDGFISQQRRRLKSIFRRQSYKSIAGNISNSTNCRPSRRRELWYEGQTDRRPSCVADIRSRFDKHIMPRIGAPRLDKIGVGTVEKAPRRRARAGLCAPHHQHNHQDYRCRLSRRHPPRRSDRQFH